MPRLILAIVAITLVAGTAWAAAPSEVQGEYTDRLLKMEDTAAAHVALAKWCEAGGLSDRAQIHWREALVRDEDNKEARAALGYVRRGMEWVKGTEAARPQPAGAEVPRVSRVPQDPTFNERQREIAKDVQDILIRYLSTLEERMRSEGRIRILSIRDPAGAEPIARILGIGSVETRKLACEALGQIPGDEAGKLLARFVLTDESDEVAKVAAAAMKDRNDRAGVQQLLNALNGSDKATARGAYALGEIGDLATAPVLISHLKKPETKVIKAPAPANGGGSSGPGCYMAVGTIVTYIANQTPVVAEAAVGWSPTIGAIPVGAVLAVQNPRVMIYRTIIEMVPQPAVHDALQKMTGEDCDYSSVEWRAAVEKLEREKARQPQ